MTVQIGNFQPFVNRRPTERAPVEARVEDEIEVTGDDDVYVVRGANINEVRRAIDMAVRERLPVDEGVGSWGLPFVGSIASHAVALSTELLYDDDGRVNGRRLGELYETVFSTYAGDDPGTVIIERDSKGELKGFVEATTDFPAGIESALEELRDEDD